MDFIKPLVIIFFTILSSYIYPSFSVFYLYFFLKICLLIKNKYYIAALLIYSIVLSIPCLIYLFYIDIFEIFNSAQGLNTSWIQSLNISNKILIISTIILYLLLPILNFKLLFYNILETNRKILLTIMVFCLISFYFFNFPYGVWGGGFFYKVSNILFNNNILFFISAFLSIIFLYLLAQKKIENYLLLILLILYNPQLTIYVKYFDPLILIVFLTLFNFDLNKHFFQKKNSLMQFYSMIVFYYLIIYTNKLYF